MYTFFKFLSCSILFLSGLGMGSFIDLNGNGNETQRDHSFMIVGGEEAGRYEFPWQIRIQWKGDKGLRCGGTILDNSTILTAAHCRLDVDSFEVLAGAHNMNLVESDTRQVINISRIYCHQGYNSDTKQNDICILKLASNLVWSTAVKPIPLSDTVPKIPGTGIVTGWGYTFEGGVPSDVLRKVTLPLVSHADCARVYQPIVGITNSMFCAGVGGKDSCQGDSGGPFICTVQEKPLLCGVVSFGGGCARPGIPGVYTQISSYRKWIVENSDGNQTDGSSITNLPSAFILLSFVVINVIFVYE